jgi:hypothetical protein
MLQEASCSVALQSQQPALPAAMPPYQLRTISLTSVVFIDRSSGSDDFDILQSVLDKLGSSQ